MISTGKYYAVRDRLTKLNFYNTEAIHVIKILASTMAGWMSLFLTSLQPTPTKDCGTKNSNCPRTDHSNQLGLFYTV